MAFGPSNKGPEANIRTEQLNLNEMPKNPDFADLEAEVGMPGDHVEAGKDKLSLRELGKQKREDAKNSIKQKATGFKGFLTKTWGQMRDIGSHLVDFKQSETLKFGGAAKDAVVGAAGTVAEASTNFARGTRDTAVAFGGAAKDAAIGAAGTVAEASMNFARGTRDNAVAFGGAAKDAAIGGAGTVAEASMNFARGTRDNAVAFGGAAKDAAIGVAGSAKDVAVGAARAVNTGIDVGFGAVSKEGRQQIAQEIGDVAGAARDAAVGAARATGERLTSWDRSPVLKAGKESMSFLGRKSTELGEAAKSGWRSTLDTFSAAKEALRNKILDTRIGMAEKERAKLEKKINALRSSRDTLASVQPEAASDEFEDSELNQAV
jgi:hypothetical protein